MNTLCIDIGGTSVKLLAVDSDGRPQGERRSVSTPSPATPESVFAAIVAEAGAVPAYQRASVGFPGVVKSGVSYNAPNLGNEHWARIPIASILGEALGVVVRVANDADLQGLGVVQGTGVELALTLGTGLGSSLFVDGHLVPNLELGHHPFREGKTYEDLIRDSELKRIGVEPWSQRLAAALRQIEALFNYDVLHLGGGNLRHFTLELPENVETFTVEEGMTGALRLWKD